MDINSTVTTCSSVFSILQVKYICAGACSFTVTMPRNCRSEMASMERLSTWTSVTDGTSLHLLTCKNRLLELHVAISYYVCNSVVRSVCSVVWLPWKAFVEASVGAKRSLLVCESIQKPILFFIK